ncbi:MAG TPA: glutamine-hydrolyzing GMP synthase [Gammaproteobacteria bacterium]|nr:glutamine-hydrolyzing GMP synthase [Gammaproteobacteria bacterium]
MTADSFLPLAADIHEQRILIIDFGSQYTQLIARRVRECGVYCEIIGADTDAFDIAIEGTTPDGIILSGGPETVTASDTPRAPGIVFELGCPVLGICYGMQTMAAQLGGEVESSTQREFGYAQVEVQGHSSLLSGIEDHTGAGHVPLLDVWMSHGDKVITLPPGFNCIASSKNSPLAGMANEERRFYGLQFHPEVTHTRQGMRIIHRFVHDICGCTALWTPKNIVEDRIMQIREQVGDDKVLLGLSGGVDSTVVAALLHEAIGDQLICVFVDTGLLRAEEGDEVVSNISEHFGIQVIRVNAAKQFFAALKGVKDPEDKRRIIGREFIRIFEQEADKLTDVRWLAQGTIYPDVIESAATKTGKAQVIKSHHNVGGLPQHMRLPLLEPLRELFKDEVRTIGLELGIPYDLVYRHPFPGPGLGVRILGEVKSEYVKILQHADAIFIQELRDADLYHKISQAFAVFLPVKSVGVKGDARKYEYVIALRAVETLDFMTAHWFELPYAVLHKVSQRILNEVEGVSRVVYDVSEKPPATIEWE